MRTIAEIATDIASRITGKDYVPQFIVRTTDFGNYALAMGYFLAPYVQSYEQWFDLWATQSLLANFLKHRGMYLTGSETLAELQTIAESRLKILVARGTMKMLAEVQRLANENTSTALDYYDVKGCGWLLGYSSPMYRSSSTALNFCYLAANEVFVFVIKNQTTMAQSTMLSILQRYFEPKHVRVVYQFL